MSPRLLLIALTLVLLPSLALANAGVPMIFISMPLMLAALVPIIAIEAFVLARSLNLSGKSAALASLTANAASTLVGVPLTWVVLVLVQVLTGGGFAYGMVRLLTKILAVTWQAPWLIPYADDLYWMIPTAQLVLLIPFFFASWFVEHKIVRWMWRDLDPAVARAAVWRANLITYGLLAVFVLGVLVWAIWTQGP
ncbi:MAG TPA: hypothetical protein DDX54_07005 [Rhodospirillaceae bacterium]|jgi:hypothetical protein|nr:hypothetical protein [Alphaproteobacteria bacterium]HBH27131.1 hypothetical protein [Rhodospirillaceae bacterium]